jgi:hypothetical protein
VQQAGSDSHWHALKDAAAGTCCSTVTPQHFTLLFLLLRCHILQSPFAATMMESCSVTQAKRLSDLFPHASKDALDLLSKLLQVRQVQQQPTLVMSHHH